MHLSFKNAKKGLPKTKVEMFKVFFDNYAKQ